MHPNNLPAITRSRRVPSRPTIKPSSSPEKSATSLRGRYWNTLLQDEDTHIDRIEELQDQIRHMTLPLFLPPPRKSDRNDCNERSPVRRVEAGGGKGQAHGHHKTTDFRPRFHFLPLCLIEDDAFLYRHFVEGITSIDPFEVDVSPLHVRVDQLHAEPVADVEPLRSRGSACLRRGGEGGGPRSPFRTHR